MDCFRNNIYLGPSHPQIGGWDRAVRGFRRHQIIGGDIRLRAYPLPSLVLLRFARSYKSF